MPAERSPFCPRRLSVPAVAVYAIFWSPKFSVCSVTSPAVTTQAHPVLGISPALPDYGEMCRNRSELAQQRQHLLAGRPPDLEGSCASANGERRTKIQQRIARPRTITASPGISLDSGKVTRIFSRQRERFFHPTHSRPIFFKSSFAHEQARGTIATGEVTTSPQTIVPGQAIHRYSQQEDRSKAADARGQSFARGRRSFRWQALCVCIIFQ